MSKQILADNSCVSFKTLCYQLNVDMTNLEYIFFRLAPGKICFKTVIPVKSMIKPCERCKKNYNSSDNFKCRKDQAGNPLVNLCDRCADRACPGYRRYVSTETHLYVNTESMIADNS